MKYLIKLKNLSLYKLIINNLFIVTINIIILLFCLNYFWMFILLILFYIYIYIYIYKTNNKINKQSKKKLIYLLLFIDIIIIISYIIHYLIIKDYSYDSFEGVVINIKYYQNYNKLTVKNNIFKVIINDYDFNDIKIGDRVFVSGVNRQITSNRIEGLFNYQNYYYSQNIISIINSKQIKVQEEFNIYYLRRIMYQYITNTFDQKSASYMLGMVLGDSTTIDDLAKESIKINGISHLFAISGLHISLLISILTSLLKKINIKDKIIENFIISILIIYLLITNFAVSIFRASLMYLFKIINKRLNLDFTNLDIISLIFILFIIINPYYIYNLGFVLSFCASFSIIILSQTFIFLNIKINGFYNLLLITLILQIISLPIIININNSINILSIITNGIFISLVSYIILPSTFLILLFPYFKIIYQYIIYAFDALNLFFSKYIDISITMPSFNNIELIIYYVFLILLVTLWPKIKTNKKVIISSLFILFILSYYNKINLNNNGNIYFLDIYEGDCTVIDLPYDDGVVVIDTGTSDCKDVITFLKSKGVRQIDFLVLTHMHNDHCGNAYNIINNFKVQNIITSAYNDNSYPNQIKLRAGDSFSINGYRFDCIGPVIKSESEENDNSLIIYSKLGNYKYLFLGDASKKIEEDLIKYKLDVDCVKVAHHGSKTSSSKKFYESINPKYVFIETGRVTKYGFPHQEALDVLCKYEIYRTDINYSIRIKFNDKRSIINGLK